MQGFQEKDTRPYPNYNDVFRILDDRDVFRMYMNCDITVGTYNSPMGAVDRHASLSIFYNYAKNKFMFKEHRYGYMGDCIDFVKEMFRYSTSREACMRIMHDFGVEGFHIDPSIAMLPSPGNILHPSKTIVPPKREVDIMVTIREWKEHDIEYWKLHGVDIEWLNLGEVYPISHYFINGSIRYAEKYAYAYIERKDNRITYKIYQPFSKENKWLNNNNASVWELWECLPETYKYLIITKSRKDALSIMSTLRIPSTSLQAEGTIPKPQVMQELKDRFDNIYLLYDNDFEKDTNYGMEYSKRLSEEYDIPMIRIPDEYAEKDYSDLVKRYGKEKAKKIITNLIIKINETRGNHFT